MGPRVLSYVKFGDCTSVCNNRSSGGISDEKAYLLLKPSADFGGKEQERWAPKCETISTGKKIKERRPDVLIIELELFYEAPTQGANTERCGLKHQLNTRAEGIPQTAPLRCTRSHGSNWRQEAKPSSVEMTKRVVWQRVKQVRRKIKSETVTQLVRARAERYRGSLNSPGVAHNFLWRQSVRCALRAKRQLRDHKYFVLEAHQKLEILLNVLTDCHLIARLIFTHG